MANGLNEDTAAQLAQLYGPQPAPPAGQNSVLAPTPETPAYIPPAPQIETAPMVEQAITAPTFEPQDRQARFDRLKEEARQQIDQETNRPGEAPVLASLVKPGQSIDEAAEDLAMERMLAEDNEVQQFQSELRSQEEAKKISNAERAQRASQLGVALPSQTVQQAEQIAATPSQGEIFDKELQIREEVAQKTAQKRVANRQAAADAEKEKQAQQKATELVEKEELTSLPELMQKGSWGQKLGAALAVMAGAYSQGLTQSKSNPVLDFMEQNFNQAMAKRKARADEKAALEAAFWKNKEFDLALEDARRKGRLTDAQIADLLGKRQQKLDEANLKLMNQLRLKAGLVKDSSELTKEDMDRAVRVPDGSYRLAVNKKQASELEKYRAEVEPAISGLQRVQELTKSGMPVDPRLRDQVNTELQAIVGSLRLPITGPGVLTDSEREMLGEIIGNPNKIFGLNIIEQRKLQTINNKLNTDLNKRYFNAGINLPKNTKEQRLDKFIKDNPGVSKEQAEKIYNMTYGE